MTDTRKIYLNKWHTITIQKANRGLDDDYLITFFEKDSKLYEEYENADYIKFQYGIKI